MYPYILISEHVKTYEHVTVATFFLSRTSLIKSCLVFGNYVCGLRCAQRCVPKFRVGSIVCNKVCSDMCSKVSQFVKTCSMHGIDYSASTF